MIHSGLTESYCRITISLFLEKYVWFVQ